MLSLFQHNEKGTRTTCKISYHDVQKLMEMKKMICIKTPCSYRPLYMVKTLLRASNGWSRPYIVSLTFPGGQEILFSHFASNHDQFSKFFLKLCSFSSSFWSPPVGLGWATRPPGKALATLLMISFTRNTIERFRGIFNRLLVTTIPKTVQNFQNCTSGKKKWWVVNDREWSFVCFLSSSMLVNEGQIFSLCSSASTWGNTKTTHNINDGRRNLL